MDGGAGGAFVVYELIENVPAAFFFAVGDIVRECFVRGGDWAVGIF